MVKGKTQKSVDELVADAMIPKTDQPYQIPDNWVWTNIGSTCTHPQYGWTTKAVDTGNVKLLRTTDITKGTLSWENVPFCQKEPSDVDKYKLFKDDILISRAGSIGYSYIIEKIEHTSVFASYLIRFKTLIDTKYLYLFLQSPQYWGAISEKSSGIALLNVNATKLKEIYLPLPPLPEQKRIVTKLTSMLEKLKQAKELIREAKESLEKRRAATLHLAFKGRLTKEWRKKNSISDAWETKPLSDVITSFQNGLAKRKGSDGEYKKVIRLADIYQHTIDISDIRQIRLTTKEIEKYSLKPEDILIIRVNGSPLLVGKFISCRNSELLLFCDHFIRIKCKDEMISPEYLIYFAQSSDVRIYVDKNKVSSAGQNTINQKSLSKMLIRTPSSNEQKEIVRILDNLLGDETEASSLLELENDINLLEKSILSKAFRGELDTNDPDDEPAKELLERILQEKQKKEVTTKKQPSKGVTIKTKPIKIGITSHKATVTVMKDEKKSFS